MKAILFEAFQETPQLSEVAAPTPTPDGAVVRVMATGVCRSDWHGWMGHDPEIKLPHVPGHEFAGIIEATGPSVTRWRRGDRVTIPFVAGCGSCVQCHSGHQQVCDAQYQPGFTGWGSFAEFVAIRFADLNLVRLPDSLDFDVAASLGCRFATSFRAVVDRARIQPGQWIAIHGCGGVGLSAIMIAAASGAKVIGIDVNQEKLALATALGASATIDASTVADVAEIVAAISGGGAHVSIDALGSAITCNNSVRSLRKRGRHVQVGLLLGKDSANAIPMDLVVARELEILGSHGMQAHRYDAMLDLIGDGRLNVSGLIGKRVALTEAAEALIGIASLSSPGVTIIDRF